MSSHFSARVAVVDLEKGVSDSSLTVCCSQYTLLLLLEIYEDHFGLKELDAGTLLSALDGKSVSWKAFGNKEALCSR
jgi:hypothetical protein